MKAFLVLVVLVVSIAPAAPGDLATEPIEAAITEIMAHPNFHQTCDPGHPFFAGKTIPLPVYTRLISRRIGIAPKQLQVLQDRRSETILALKKILANLHPEKPSTSPSRALISESERPDQLNALHLFMVSDLHLTDALPELLALEERLRGAIQHADEHPQAPPPDVAIDGWIYHPRNEEFSARERLIELGRVDQRDILSLMLRLLREQKYRPLLESEFERRYLEKYQSPPGEIIAAEYTVEMPFSGAAREKIRELVRQYLAEHPPAN